MFKQKRKDFAEGLNNPSLLNMAFQRNIQQLYQDHLKKTKPTDVGIYYPGKFEVNTNFLLSYLSEKNVKLSIPLVLDD